MRRLLLLLIISSSFNLYAQLDTKHYIPPMHARADDASGTGEDIYLVLSTPQTTAFDVTITDGAGNVLFTNIQISRSAPVSLALSTASGASKGTGTKFLVTSTQLATVLSDEGLILSANKAFFANIRIDESAQAESLTSKGTAGLGTEFRSGHVWNNSGATNLKSHIISFMATEDNTTVTVSDFKNVDFENVSEAGGTITVNLNAGQSYVLVAYADGASDNLNNVNGTRISSDKPIIVNTGSWLGGSPTSNQQGRDIGIDQIAPIEQTGFEYILVKGQGTANENVVVVAGIDGTNIYVNGSSTPINSTPLNAGEYYLLTASDYTANENMHLSANQPVYVYQGLNGVADSNERQNGLNYVPPILCLGGTNVDLMDVSQLGNAVIQIIGEVGATVTITNQSGVTTDISSQAKAVTGNSNYVTYKVSGYTGNITVESPRPIRVALTMESGNIGVAGFFSGFTTTPVVESPNGYNSTTCIPDNLPVTLTAKGFDSYQWKRDGVTLTGETSASLSVTSPGIYTAEGVLSGCVPSEQSFPLTISLCPGDVGAAKNEVSVNNISGSIFDVVFDVVVTNFSSTNPAPNVQIIDDIMDGLPSGATASIQVAPAIISGSLSAGGLNTNYDGVSDLAMLDTSSNPELAVGASITIRYTVRIDMSGATSPAYSNQAIVSTSLDAFNDGITANFDNQDFSDAGTDPDADDDGDPTESGENDVTTVCVDNTVITYDTDTYYTTGTDPTPVITGLSGGSFSSSSGLTISSTTGTIDLSASIIGTYTVTYSFGGLCPTTTTVTIDLNPPAEPTVVSQTTNSSTPVITGSAVLQSGETLSVTVNSVTYTLGDGNLSLSGSTWTLTIPPGNAISPDGTYNVTATISNGVTSTDDLTSNELKIDTQAPSVDIQGEPAIAFASVPFSVTFEFTENVTGFTVTDLVVGNAISSGFTAVDGNTYTVSITPNGSGDVTIDIPASAGKDVAGNNNTAAPQATVPLEKEATYTVNAAQNVDSYANAAVLATVADPNGSITNAVVSSGSLPAGVALNATTGSITVSNTASLVAGTTTFDVTTTDEDGGTTTQSVSITFTADNEAIYTVNAAQNVDSYANADVLATVADADGAITNAIVSSGSLPAGVALNATTGAITVSNATSLVAGTTTFDVTVTDEDGGKTTQSVSITFTADNEAIYTVNAAQNVDSYANADVLATVADADGAITNAIVSSGSLPAGVALNATTGAITVSNATSLVAGTTTFDVTVTDEDGGKTTKTISITFTADNEAIYTVNAAQNVDSYANADVLATVADADGAITNAVVSSGSLPAGVALNATTGAITVSNAASLVAGTTTFDVTTTDEDGGTTTQSVSITFTADNEAIYTVNAAQNVDSYANADVLATVADADGTITNAVVSSGSLPAGVALNATTGAITVSNATSLVAGTTSFDVTTTDEDGGKTTKTISITFTADNEAIYTVNAAQNVDSYANADVLATVADADGAITNAVVSSGSLPAGVALNATTGAITVSNATSLVAGTTTFDVTVTDEDGGKTTKTISITFTADNEAIYTVNAAQNVDSYANADVLATVADADGAITNAVVSSGSLPAGVALNATTGAITVSNATSLVAGTTTFDVTTTDEDGGTTTQSVSITFTADNEAIYTVNAAQNVDSYANADVLATVADADGAITNAVVSSGSLPAGVALNATTGSITVNNAASLVAGTTTFDVTTTDEDGGKTTKTISITFTADNEAIYTVNAAQNVDSYANADVLATVADADGTITNAVVSSGSLPAGVALNATTGAITVSNATSLVAGTTTFDVTITDEDGGKTTQSVSITFTADNEAIYTVNAAKNVDSYSNADVLATVADADGAITNAVVSSGSLPAGVALNATTGAITVSNATSLVAGTTTFDVTVTDEDGGKTTKTISITFTADNEAIYTVNAAQNVDSYSNADVLATVADADGAITNAVVSSGSLPAGVALNATTGAITVSNATSLVAGTTSFDVTTTDEDGGKTTKTISITFTADNEAIYTVNAAQNIDSYSNADVLATVADADGAITNAIVSSGSLPAGVALNATTGAVTVNSAASLVAGTTTFDVTTTDEDGGKTTKTISITFTADNEAIYTVNAEQNVDSYANADVLATVADADGAITNAVVSSGSLPAGVALNATTGAITVSNATSLVAGTTTFDVTTTDEDGGKTTKTISITFTADNEAIYTVNAAQNVDSYANADVLATVTDADGAITNAIVSSGLLPAGIALNATTGAITVSTATSLVAGTTSFDVTTTDEDGGKTTKTISITFTADNEAIYTVNATQNVDSYANADVLATVADADGAITNAVVSSGSLPAGVALNATTGSITVNNAASLVAGTTTFDVTTTDEDGGKTTKTISITFTADNEAIYTVNAAQNVDSYANADVLATVADADGAITNAVVSSGSLPAGVALNATTGAITASTATSLVAGTTSFDVTTTDEDGGMTTQSVSITFTADNEAIYTVNAAQNVDSYANADVLATVADADGAITNAVVSSGSLPAGVALNATTGAITVSNATSLVAGTTTFDVTITDEDGGKTTQSVSITFTADNEAIYTVNAAQNVDSYANADVLATVADADGAITNAVVSSGSLPAGVALNATTGAITVSNATSLVAGTTSFDVTTTDEDGGKTTKTISITFTADNEAIYTVNAAQNVDSYANADVLATVADADGAITNAVVSSGSLPAGVALNATTGAITVSNATSLVAGTTTFDVTITDEDGGKTTQSVSITFTADNEAIYTVNAAQNVDGYANADVLATVADADGAITNAIVSSGSLPAGVALSATTGAITVSNATSLVAGTTTFDVTTTDEDGGKTTQSVSITFIADNEAIYTVNAAQNVDSYSNADVLATVADADGAITNAVVSSGSLPSGVALNATTGSITVSNTASLVAGTTTFDVTVTDEDGGKTTKTISITFTADNEAIYTVNAAQNVDSYANADVLATVADADGAITNAVVSSGSLPAGVALNATTGSITVNNAASLVAGTTTFDVTTTDEDGGKTTQSVSITFTADNEAIYTVNAAQNVDSYANADVLATVADADGAITNAVVSSGSLPAGVALNATTGSITVNNAASLGAGTTTFDVTTTDEDGGKTTKTISITFTADNEAIYTVNAAQNVDSYANADVLATVADADGAITNAVVSSGSLPAGVALNATTGSITVNNAASLVAGTTTFDVTTTDEDGGETTKTISITFTADNEAIYTVNAAQNVDSYANADVLATVADADGAITNAIVSSGSLPAGVALNATTGEVTVTDASLLSPGTTTFDITITDEDGGTTIQTISITFTADNEAIYTVNPAQNVDSYTNGNVLASVADADGAITNAIVSSGMLPAGVSLNATTGAITVSDASLLSGGTTTFDITITDEDGGITTQTISITFTGDIDAIYTLSPSHSIDSYANGDVLATVADADGSITTAVLTNGALPAGTSLNTTTGEITVSDKSALVPGDYNIEITTTDAAGGTTAHLISISFDGDTESVYAINESMPVNDYESGDVLASVADNDGTITNATLTSGSLPPGTSLNPSTGEITVTDTNGLQPGNYTAIVTTTDDNGGQTSTTVSIEILTSTLDSDNDNVLDINEDINDDGDLENDDSDGDGVPDYMDADDDGDGILTADEDINQNNNLQDDDADNDGIPNYLDDDDDNDGILTKDEDANGNQIFTDDDCDEDGIVDYLDADLCNVKPSLGFSPNDDGNNDFWKINGIDYYPDNEVKVFNRWGNLVFETKGYNNTNNAWGGDANGKLLLGKTEVPDGTYFYMIKINHNKPVSGYVIVKR